MAYLDPRAVQPRAVLGPNGEQRWVGASGLSYATRSDAIVDELAGADFGGTPPPPEAPRPPRRRWILRWVGRGLGAFVLLLIIAAIYLAITAPLSQSLQPPAPPSITLLASDGTPIARSGAVIGEPVDAAALPEHVTGAFLSIEDRNFRSHMGISLRGIVRSFVNNSFTDNAKQGGSTITQQLAKNAFLTADRTFTRKAREALIALWLEAWLTKDEILSRYLSNVYFGDNVYGLDAAANHYFSRSPEDLTVSQAAMLAGLVKAPSRLAPTGNLEGARERAALVVAAMAETGVLTEAEAEDVRPARLQVRATRRLPTGGYFADWVMSEARDNAGEIATEQTVTTTLETRLQRAAEAAVRSAGLRTSQVALVAMRPDGSVVAMVGGKNYAQSPFNRATQARRQPGSTFKLFVYLAALRDGMSPDSLVEDEPVTMGDWSPKNSDGVYRGEMTLRQAFALSSNVAAARLTRDVGPSAVIRAARDLGISTDIPNEASIALGTSSVSLLELTAAYAAIAAGEAPVRPHGIPIGPREQSWLDRLTGSTSPLGRRELAGMRSLLAAGVERGTGRQAALSIDAYGKTGTTQDNRDALFVGYAGDLVVGVWLGNDDNTPNAGLAGGGLPARIWRDFMQRALGVAGPARAAPVDEAIEDGNAIDALVDGVIDGLENGAVRELEGLGLDLRLDGEGGIELRPGAPGRGDAPGPPPDRDRRAEGEGEDF